MSDRAPPYPADTRAKGWRFELDYERIEQSGTWAAAMAAALDGLPLARPLLLAMWYAAWKQVPCGSLPADDVELAGAIGVPRAVFAEYRDVLLRGWWLASDGRLYHDTIAARALEMLSYRSKNAERVAKFKAAKREQRAGNALPQREQLDNNDTGTGTIREEKNPPTPRKRGRGSVHDFPPGFESFWSAYPRKTAKDKAVQAFARIKPDDAMLRRMLAALALQRQSPQWIKDDGQFVPHASTWLNGRRWEDEAPSSVAAAKAWEGAL